MADKFLTEYRGKENEGLQKNNVKGQQNISLENEGMKMKNSTLQACSILSA